MAVGPHSADAAQEFVDHKLRSMPTDDGLENDLLEVSPSHEGRVSTEFLIDEIVFDQTPSVSQQDKYIEFLETTHDGIFQGLDLIYDAIKTTRGNKRLEGLRGYRNHFYGPGSEATEHRWDKLYQEAGLVHDGDITPEGEVFLDIDPRLEDYDFNDIKFGNEFEVDVGEIYRDLRTTSDCAGGAHNGDRIKTFVMYGAGFDDREISERLFLPYENIRQTRQNLQDLGLIADNHRLTPDGREFYSMMLDQIDQVKRITEGRLQEYQEREDNDYSEGFRAQDPEEFEGNFDIAKALS